MTPWHCLHPSLIRVFMVFWLKMKSSCAHTSTRMFAAVRMSIHLVPGRSLVTTTRFVPPSLCTCLECTLIYAVTKCMEESKSRKAVNIMTTTHPEAAISSLTYRDLQSVRLSLTQNLASGQVRSVQRQIPIRRVPRLPRQATEQVPLTMTG